MKTLITFLCWSILLLLPAMMSSQQISLSQCFGGNASDFAHDIKPTSDGGFIMVGYTKSSGSGDVTGFNHGGKDYWIVKFTSTGELQWQKNYGGSAHDEAWGVCETAQHDFVIAGYSYSNDGNVTDHIGTSEHSDAWIIRIDMYGQLLWTHSFGTESDDMAIDITCNLEDHLWIAGRVSATGQNVENLIGMDDYWLIDCDLEGNISWENVYGGLKDDILQDMLWTLDNEIYLVGYSYSQSDGPLDGEAYVVKVNASGDKVWDLDLGTDTQEGLGFAGRMCETEDGNICVSYRSSNGADEANCNSQGAFLVRRISPDGDILNEMCYGGSGTDQPTAVAIDANNHTWLLGTTYSTDGDVTEPAYTDIASNVWLAALDNDGDVLWNQSMGGTRIESGCSMLVTNDNHVVLVGNSTSLNGEVVGQHDESGHTYDVWLVMLDMQTVKVAEKQTASLSLYPNPVSAALIIETSDPDSNGWLTVFNQMGQAVDGIKMNAARVSYDTSSLATGIYTVQVVSKGVRSEPIRFVKE